MAPKPLEFLARLKSELPALGDCLDDLGSLYERKLWHQLTLRLEEVFQDTSFRRGNALIRLYTGFITDFASKLNLLKLAQMAVTVSELHEDAPSALVFLEGVLEKLKGMRHVKTEEPIAFVRMHIAQQKLRNGEVDECRVLIDEGKEALEGLADVDPTVHAAYHLVCSLYHKHRREFAEFYRSALMYLAYKSSESLPEERKLSLAVDISFSALLADDVYNFGELLLHPIINVLDTSQYKWLHELLEVFNQGDMHTYEEMCVKYASVLNEQPALVENERKLKEKLTIMCLLELIFSLPAEERRIPLKVIGERTKLSLDGVEFLLMRALSLHLIEGTIDQVDGYVQVSWVQPRVLTRPEMQGLLDHLDAWISKVKAVNLSLEQETVGVVEV
ncbi:unnamed protein product [Ostreobium quekettii]|uniref:PCI domain-containing protein n=1 Tax=Ostreobium quekettii TaxID=121088 RepID=A0A8S1JDN1_9CHLO|nr:unnamed protein product [Ostreobium quekettii]